jgi:predicted Zn-ribbon and HTH transcriptional regulator
MFGRIPRVPKQASDIVTTTKDIVRKNRVTKGEYLMRMSACNKCVYLLKALDVCKKCGCFVKMKAMSPSMECPIGKWSLSETSVDSPKDEGGHHDTDEVGADGVSTE